MSEGHVEANVEISEAIVGRKRRKKSIGGMSVLRYLADSETKRCVPELSSLTQHGLCLERNDANGHTCLSPGSFFGNRIAMQDISRSRHAHSKEQTCSSRHRIFVASGRDVYRVSDDLTILNGNRQKRSLKKGKGGMYLPDRPDITQSGVVSRSVPMLQMRAEVQSIHITQADSSGDSNILLTDTYGRAVCGTLSVDEDCVKSVYTMQPDDGAFVCEGGWTGGVLSPHSKSLAAIARHFPKDVTIFDGGIPVRTLHTLYCPNDVVLLRSDLLSSKEGQHDATPLLAVAEGNAVTIWDLRIAGRAARINRITTGPYSGQLYTITATSSGCSLLGASGQDRDVCVWDPRTWKTVDRWRNCLKYEVTSLHFLHSNPKYCILSGMDYEVLCGSWFNNTSKAFQATVHRQSGGRAAGPTTDVGSMADTARQERVIASFRGTSRWIGFTKAPGENDIFAGVTTDGTIYISEFM